MLIWTCRKTMKHSLSAFCWLTMVTLTGHSVAATVDCQADRSGDGLALYLYFPTADDADFPSPMFMETTTPLPAFNASDLDAAVGSTAEFRDAITERVKTDYCEFDVRVVQTTSAAGTTNPTPTDDRWYVVGFGGDSNANGFYGVCCNSGMATVFAGQFAAGAVPGGLFDGLLTPGDGSLNRWSNAIAGTASHEPGHSSTLGNPGHGSSASRPTEDVQQNHIMATGSVGSLTGQDRIEDRHFSDTSYEIIAGALGLYEQTLSNWDFINPNDTAADGLRITILIDSDAGTPEIGSVYDGGLSPWGDASIVANGTLAFQGETYDRYLITFTEPQGWNNGDAGEIPAGEEFHVGVGLTTNYIVNQVTLTNGGTAMPLRPRVVGYTPDGSFNPETGDYHLTLSVPDPENGPMIVSDVKVHHLPRTLDINQMITGGALLGVDGRALVPWRDRPAADVEVVDAADLAVGNLVENRAVDFMRELDPECGGLPQLPPVGDHPFRDASYCEEGRVLGLFPAARVYLEATVTDPNARYFDRAAGTMVTGPLSSRIFIQFTGKVPDLNGNGVDDAVDIDTGFCLDQNGNGVCDDVEPVRYKYAAKLICGEQPLPNDGRLVKGSYATTINVLNLSTFDARLIKTLSLSYPPEEQRAGEVVELARDVLSPNEALKVDCPDVLNRAFPDGLPAPYIEGYVTIESATQLDVTGVYSSRDVEPAQRCDVPKLAAGCVPDSCGERTACCGHGEQCASAPALSTTLNIVPVREHVVAPPAAREPQTSCPDLRVSISGRPRVNCPTGTGSCVTELQYVLQNIGDEPSGPFEATAILDPNQSVSVVEPVASLLPGQSRTVSIVTPPGGNCFDPDCTIRVTADSSGRVAECDEQNNTDQKTTGG